MSATTIFFNGRLISVPGSYSEVDASGLEQIGLSAAGIVGLIGTAEGGTPATTSLDPKDLQSATRPETVRTLFRDGDLREGGAMLFEPSNDPEISGGAQQVIFAKTNQATQSSRTFGNGFGDSMIVTSEDFGAFTEQINMEIQNGSSQGKLVTSRFEDQVQSADNLGGIGGVAGESEMFNLQYSEFTGLGWDLMTSQVLSGSIRARGVRSEAGLDSDVTVGIQSTAAVQSTDAGDTTQLVTVYGLVAGVPTRETVQLAGLALVPTNAVFDAASVFAVEMDGVAIGSVTVEDSATTVMLTMAPAALSSGGVRAKTMFVAGTPTHLVLDAAGTENVWLVGTNAAGSTVIDRVTMAGTSPVDGAVLDFSEISFIVLGELPAARTVEINAYAVRTLNTTQNTLLKVADFFNARQLDELGVTKGFVFTIVTSLLTFSAANLDLTSAPVDVDNPVTGRFFADLFFAIDYLNGANTLANAVRIVFVGRADDLTITPAVATFTWVINGVTLTYVSGAGTAADIQAGIIQQTNANEAVNQQVTAAANGSAAVRITSDGPAGHTISETDANLALANVNGTTGVGQVPDNTTAPVFLTGGSEGLSTFTDFQNALNLFKFRRINTIVVLTGDPAVHAALKAHCDFMGGIGRSERDGCVGLLNSALTGLPTKTEIKSQVVDLNTRHLRAFGQEFERFNTAGEKTTFDSRFLGCIAAGMQAGSDVGTSLTFKFANILSISQDPTWNPLDDAEELLQAGLCFLEEVDGIGRRFVRNITTHLSSSNLAFVEASVNEAVNFSVFNFRTEMEVAVGKKGFSGTLNAAKSVAIGTLGLLVDAEVLVAFQSLSLDLFVDVLEVEVQIAPVIPINFVKNTLHLVTIRQAA